QPQGDGRKQHQYADGQCLDGNKRQGAHNNVIEGNVGCDSLDHVQGQSDGRCDDGHFTGNHQDHAKPDGIKAQGGDDRQEDGGGDQDDGNNVQKHADDQQERHDHQKDHPLGLFNGGYPHDQLLRNHQASRDVSEQQG